MQAKRRRCREPVRPLSAVRCPLSFRGGVPKPDLEVCLLSCGGRARVRRSARFPSIEATRIARLVLHGIFFSFLPAFLLRAAAARGSRAMCRASRPGDHPSSALACNPFNPWITTSSARPCSSDPSHASTIASRNRSLYWRRDGSVSTP